MVVVDASSPLRARRADRQFRELADQINDLSERPEWHTRANCRGLTSFMFPTESTARAAARAISVCSGCPVFDRCAEAGAGENDGVWGGRLRTRGARKRAARQAS